jgi:hypothetical protein
MIINNDEASKRLNSPLNLINRLRESKTNAKAKAAMAIFIPPKGVMPSDTGSKQSVYKPEIAGVQHPAENTETLDQILENHEAQINLGLAHDSALKLLTNSISSLATKLDDVKPDKLPAAIMAASKVVESIRRERAEASKNNKDREVHYHFYTPEQKQLTDYEVIEVQ